MTAHSSLVRERLDAPGAWLRDKVGGALDGFFQKPYLLWFVAEDPVRNGKLPANIADVTRAIIRAATRERVETLREQLDYALRLASWSWIARDSHVQIDLVDVLIDAGASPDGNPDNALVNGNFAAAGHLVARDASLTLATARDRIVGCLTGIATGDAIGKQTEMLSREDVLRRYPHGIRGFEGTPGDVIPRYAGNSKREWRIGETTDDTERMLAVARAIIAERNVSPTELKESIPRYFKRRHASR